MHDAGVPLDDLAENSKSSNGVPVKSPTASLKKDANSVGRPIFKKLDAASAGSKSVRKLHAGLQREGVRKYGGVLLRWFEKLEFAIQKDSTKCDPYRLHRIAIDRLAHPDRMAIIHAARRW